MIVASLGEKSFVALEAFYVDETVDTPSVASFGLGDDLWGGECDKGFPRGFVDVVAAFNLYAESVWGVGNEVIYLTGNLALAWVYFDFVVFDNTSVAVFETEGSDAGVVADNVPIEAGRSGA